MVHQNKQRQALQAINLVLVCARRMVYENQYHKDLAYVLDMAEYLPAPMLEERDATDDFRGVLEDLAGKYKAFNIALEQFEADP